MYRVGFAKDIHALKKGRDLIIGGVCLPFGKGEDAHSDGDVLFHAIGESLLGALSLGDLGYYFPGTKENKDINSEIIVKKCLSLIKEKGYEIVNIDTSIELENFKLAPHINNIRVNVSKVLSINLDQISIKANTNEGFGSVGKGESIIAYSYVLLKKRVN